MTLIRAVVLGACVMTIQAQPNIHGKVPVLEYHLVGDHESMYSITREHFQHDLDLLYAHGYRPITVSQLVDKQIDDQARVHGIPRENVIRDVILAPQPTKQFVKIEDVAALALYLASEAAAQVNGTSVSIDGGWTAR